MRNKKPVTSTQNSQPKSPDNDANTKLKIKDNERITDK